MAKLPVEYPVVAAMYEAASGYERGGKRHYLGMSSLGDPCPRKLWLGFRGYTPSYPEGRVKMIFDLGDRVEEAVVQWLELAGYQVLERQRAFEGCGGYLRGHWDGAVDGISSRRHVLEIKSANAARFQKFVATGVEETAPVYFAQMQLYMGFSGLERALFVVMNKNDCALYTERVYFNRTVFNALLAKAESVVFSSTPPDGVEGPLCRYCDYSRWCRPEEGNYVLAERTCGTCTHCAVSGQTLFCSLHGKPFAPEKWGRCCSKWEQSNAATPVPDSLRGLVSVGARLKSVEMVPDRCRQANV